MTDYARFAFGFSYSSNSDYSAPSAAPAVADYEVTPDEYVQLKLETTDAGVALNALAHLATGTGLLVKNLSATSGDDVTLVIDDSDGNTITSRIPPGGVTCVADFDPSSTKTLTADSGKTVSCLLIATGT